MKSLLLGTLLLGPLLLGPLLLGLSACGKVGGPTPVGPPDQITFPKTFPTH